ncbi:unnamed protein product [Coregonus sp. 'balchen']|nr:unnamed protein product [Coregonus sp. 'balchen']
MSMEGLSSFQNLQALSALLSTQDEDDEYNFKKDSKAIWSEEEVTEGSQFDDLTDTRPKPEYDILLKQNVGTEDVFLGMSRKDPSSMCCDSMLVKIKLPDTKATDVVLDVKEKFLDLRTPNLREKPSSTVKDRSWRSRYQ